MQTVRVHFRTGAIKVFQEVLGKPMPESLTVDMAVSNRDEIEGECAARLASFNSKRSTEGALHFTIREITIRTLLQSEDSTLFESTVVHEMFHATDLFMLNNGNKLIQTIRNAVNNKTDVCCSNKKDGLSALLGTLQVLHHYRAEGVAILGESLVMKNQFGPIVDVTSQFCSVFKFMMMRSQMRLHDQETEIFDEQTFHTAYAVAPIILLMILDKRGDIKHNLAQKALKALDSGHFDLTDDEARIIMQSALSLSLSGYIQGLMCIGDQVSPIRPFLDFCGQMQDECDDENISVFEKLVQEPENEGAFNTAMDSIMGCCIPDEELNRLYNDFMENSLEDDSYLQVKEKLTVLHRILNNDMGSDRQRIAQWALTYFFDDEDVIHDDVPGIGLVDDITILDYAIRLLNL